MKLKKWISAGLIVVIIVAIIVYNYMYQEHRDIATETPAYTETAATLLQAFQNDEDQATAKYLNKTVQLQGAVSDVEAASITLESSVFFALSENINATASLKNQIIVIKGRCIGYDSLLEEIKFDQAVIIN